MPDLSAAAAPEPDLEELALERLPAAAVQEPNCVEVFDAATTGSTRLAALLEPDGVALCNLVALTSAEDPDGSP